jgi:soluble lytic murein transglycosylase
MKLLASLAGERSYYGFLAADELGQDYALGDQPVDANETVMNELANRPDMIRARELFLVGLDSRGRSEWNTIMASLSPEQKIQAARLASRWGWHSRAIAAVASAGAYDDLSIRYPLPYRQNFTQSAKSASILPTWAYSIARSESLFMRDVRSSAGAVGLMQLMPATGRQVARQLGLPYSGLDTLTNPQDNIRLGTSYLGQMAARYGGNRVLATAAYNAGPHRVDSWLPASGNLDARIWIETIPFNETRKYVRRVMAAETIFHWRITGETRRLSEALARVQATPKPQRLARN